MHKTILAVLMPSLLMFGALMAYAGEPLYYDKGVMDKDTTWSGEVVVRGQAVVKKGATLTIEPGTVIKFVWTDEDGDNIGDGELNVEGRIIAKGEKDNMITFTSAREDPAPKDWTFLMISVNRDSLVEYCVFEYAFTGIQAHYSTATIRNNLIRNNFEGIRFSTTDVLIEHNDITGNTYGIRYESRGSKTVVTHNLLKDNENAFFPLKKCDGTVVITDNNVSSIDYNVKVGQDQRADLDYGMNWWGTDDPAEIEAGFFDRRKDPALGKVLYEPPLDAPAADCGML